MLIDTHKARGKDVFVVGEMHKGPKDTSWKIERPRWLVNGDTFGEAMDKVLEGFGTEILEKNSQATLGPLLATEIRSIAEFQNTHNGWERILYVCRFKDWDQNRVEPALAPISLYHTRVVAFGVEQEVRVKYRKMLRPLTEIV
jgi:hypothetical protein